MTAESILTVSAAVMALTQLLKWAVVPDKWGPLLVLVLSLLGVLFWIWTQNAFVRTEAFSYFAAWVAVSVAAAGVYGFSRASGNALTKLSAPPGGAGDQPTVKS